MGLHHVLEVIIPYLAASIEILGVIIIAYGCVASLFLFFRSKLDFNNKDVKLELAQALALALEFKLAAEILKSVVVNTLDELILLAAIVALRVVMTLLIHWEIQTSESEGESLMYRQQSDEVDTLSNVYGRKRRKKRGAPLETSSVVSSQGSESQVFLHHQPIEAAADEAETEQTEPTSYSGSTYETHGGQRRPIVLSHTRSGGVPNPDESLHSITRPHGSRHQVTREEDGLTVTLERQIRRMTRRRRQVHQTPDEDVKEL